MKKYLVLIIAGILFKESTVFGQFNKDSLLLKSTRILQRKFNFSDSTAKLIITAGRQQLFDIDDLNKNKTLKIEDRGKELLSIKDKYDRKLQTILSRDQWSRYTEIEAAKIDSFLLRMKNTKITIKQAG